VPKRVEDLSAFISHNIADKESARILAIALVEQGIDVWFDAWEIRPGDSIVGGIEAGLERSNLFVLVWSENASRSGWVGKEVAAYLHKQAEEPSMRMVPVLLDKAPLPALLADYKYVRLDDLASIDDIASEIAGRPTDSAIAAHLQRRLLQLTEGTTQPGDPLPYLVCPSCGSPDLERGMSVDYARDDTYHTIRCTACSWSEWTE
jgi:hypothetical protein